MSDSYVVNLEDFEERVLAASRQRPILVDFWADWCGPCRVISPILESIISDYAGKVALAKLEVDEGENMKLAGRYKVRGFPTVILFVNAEEVDRFSGARPKQAVEEFMDKYLA